MSRYLAFASAVLTSLLLVSAAGNRDLHYCADQAIVRAKPGITHPVLTVVPQGAILPVLETQEEWYKILSSGREGWITGRLKCGGRKES